MSEKLSSFGSHSLILTLLLFASVIFNIYLATEVKSTKNTINTMARNRGLRLGQKAKPLEANTLQNEPFEITYNRDDKPIILYFFDPKCHWCDLNSPSINSLSNEVSETYRVVSIALRDDNLDKFIEQKDYKFPVYHNPTEASRWAYDLSTVPMTVVVKKNGMVDKIWEGAFMNEKKEEIEQYFDLTLPPIKSEEKGK